MLELSDIISAGQAAYQNSLPDYARDDQRDPRTDEPSYANISGVTEARQIQICLRCELAECVDVTDPRCPIRIEQRRLWRNRR